MKWSKYKGAIPEFKHESEYQQKVEAKKAEFAGKDAPELGELFKKTYQDRNRLKDQVADATIVLEALSQMLVTWFSAAGLESVRLLSGGTLSEVPEPFPRVRDQEEFYSWLGEAHPSEKLTLPSSTLARIVREKLLDGEPLPPGIEVFMKSSIKFFKGKGGPSGQG